MFAGSKQSYLDLTDAQLTKLRQLSLISLAAREKVISYAALQKELDIASTNLRTLEDLVIDTIYAVSRFVVMSSLDMPNCAPAIRTS